MSDLYNKVKRIVEANTKEEAENLLYGSEGIQINSTEYYQNIISNFVRKKEIILPKDSHDNIIYDLDENIEDIWDIVFISQYIQEQWIKEKKELEKEKIQLKRKIKIEKDPIIKEQLNNRKKEIIELEGKINQYFQNINQLEKINIESTKYIDETKYNEQLLELKKAIRIMQKLRDSFEHKNNNLNIDKTITIDNEKNKFKITIPTEYLDGFTKGRIIAKEQDKYLIEKTNNITYPLLQELNYDPKKIESFFYNVEPNFLSYLLEYLNYDINKLYQLPTRAFWNAENTIKIIDYIKNYENGFELLKNIPDYGFNKNDDTIKLIEYIKNIEEGNNNSKEITNNTNNLIKQLPPDAFYWAENSIELIKYLTSIDNGIRLLPKLPNTAFAYNKNTINLIKYIKSTTNNIDILTKLPDNAFEDTQATIKLINYFNSLDEGLELLPKLPNTTFVDTDIKNRIELIEYIKKLDNGLKIISETPNLFIYWAKDTMKLIKYIKNTTNNIEILTKLPEWAFNNVETTIELIEYMKNLDNGMKILCDLPNYSLKYKQNIIKLIEYIKNTKYNIQILTKLPEGAFCNVEATIELIKYFTSRNKGIEKLTELSNLAYIEPQSTIKLIEYLESKDIEPAKLSEIPKELFMNFDKKVKLFEKIDENDKSLETFSLVCTLMEYPVFEKEKNDHTKEIFKTKKGLELLKKLPKEAHQSFYFDSIILKIEEINNNREKITEETIELIKKIPKKLYKHAHIFSNLNKNNIEYLYSIVNGNNELLDQFPIEFFTCDINILDEMLSKYNYNLCRSIFGIDNPKIISLLIYMNNVYSSYSKDMANDININPTNIIEGSLNDTYKYKNNIVDKDINRNFYINQFIIDEKEIKNNPNIMQINYTNSGFHKNANGEYFNPNIDEYDKSYNPNDDLLFMPKRNIEQIKEYIIRKLRNSSAHFRFKLVKDKEGNIIEDKIYLYDEDKNGNNFNIILNINDALDITRKVELGIKEFKDNEELNNNQKSK